jgi:Na+-transporting NADH:ubiquinone oxidoreductase subunit NqrC
MEMPESVRRQISNFDVMLTNSETEFKKYSDYHRTRAYSRSLLHDITGALDYAKKAYDLAPDSLPAAYTLATLHLANKSEANSRDILRPFVIQLLDSTLTKSSLDDIFDTYLMRDTFATFFKAATWSGLSNEVIDLTKVWKEVPGDLKGTFVFSRATALRRAHEATRPDHPDRQRDLLEAARLLKFALIELERPPKFLKGEVVNIYNEINYTIENNLVAPEFANEINLAFKSLAGMISLVEQNSHSIDLESQDGESPNIQKDANSVDKLGVEIYATKPTYAYARDVLGNAYFVPLASFNTKMTVVLKVGQKIKIWGYEENEIKNGSRKANFASF